MEQEPIKVGDKLAFRYGWNHGWQVFEVTSISKTGRIKAGHFEMNPDLRIRGVGGRGYQGPYVGERITPEIRSEIRRDNLLAAIRDIKWTDQLTVTLESVIECVRHGEKLKGGQGGTD